MFRVLGLWQDGGAEICLEELARPYKHGIHPKIGRIADEEVGCQFFQMVFLFKRHVCAFCFLILSDIF